MAAILRGSSSVRVAGCLPADDVLPFSSCRGWLTRDRSDRVAIDQAPLPVLDPQLAATLIPDDLASPTNCLGLRLRVRNYPLVAFTMSLPTVLVRVDIPIVVLPERLPVITFPVDSIS